MQAPPSLVFFKILLADFCHFIFQMNYRISLFHDKLGISNWKHTNSYITLGKIDTFTVFTGPIKKRAVSVYYSSIYVLQ